MQEFSLSPWKMGVIAGDIMAVLLAALIVWRIWMRRKDETANPEKYWKPGEKKAEK